MFFIRTVFAELRRRAHELLGLKSSQCGAVTFVQRFNDALNLAPHFHSLVINGVYAADGNGKPEFHELPPPEDDDVARVATLVAKRVESLMKRRGLGPDDDPDAADALSRDQPVWPRFTPPPSAAESPRGQMPEVASPPSGTRLTATASIRSRVRAAPRFPDSAFMPT